MMDNALWLSWAGSLIKRKAVKQHSDVLLGSYLFVPEQTFLSPKSSQNWNSHRYKSSVCYNEMTNCLVTVVFKFGHVISCVRLQIPRDDCENDLVWNHPVSDLGTVEIQVTTQPEELRSLQDTYQIKSETVVISCWAVWLNKYNFWKDNAITVAFLWAVASFIVFINTFSNTVTADFFFFVFYFLSCFCWFDTSSKLLHQLFWQLL